MNDGKKLISVIVPIFNEEQSLKILFNRLQAVTGGLLEFEWEFILVNDGSSDKSGQIIDEESAKDVRIKYLEFSRNFGKEIAMTAGLNNCRGEAAIIIDADLQHPPELMAEFIKKWQAGAEVVVGVRKTNKGEGAVKKMGSALFYYVINKIAEMKIVPRATDFRLLDRVVIDEFNRFTETNRMTRALIDWLGFKRDYVYFDANERCGGEAGYNFWKLFKLAMSSFVSLSLLPLKIAGYLGIIISLLSGLLGIYVLLGKYIFYWSFPSGFTGTAQLGILIVFLVGVILVCLGLMALYIANIHSEVIGRPRYVARKKNW